MNATAINSIGARKSQHDGFPLRLQSAARISGLLYVVLFALGMFSPLVLESLIVDGDSKATVDRVSDSLGLFGTSLVTWTVIVVADIVISVTLYLLLEPVSRSVAIVTAAFRLIYSALLGAFLLNLFSAFSLLNGTEQGAGVSVSSEVQAFAAIESFENGFQLALVFFGIHLIGLGYLLWRSAHAPVALSATLMVAGAGYIVNTMAGLFLVSHGDVAATVLLIPALLGELGLTMWLLAKGFRKS